ncbi:MAG: hypothetical protein NC098_07260 [Lachnoclostridium sp.]|nr:hypothetical protein [Lachnoclostridium sp.]
MKSLKYIDETDRCYGAAGMAIGLVAFDGEDFMVSLSIDRDPGDMMEMSSDFYFSGNPEISAKSAWNRIVNNFNLSIVMLISNVLCRNIIHGKLVVDRKLHDEILDLAKEEGNSVCGLDADETERLFDKDFSYLNRLFTHYGVRSVADDFVSVLSSRRSMSRMEILDRLQSLNML